MVATTPKTRKAKGREFQKMIVSVIKEKFGFPDEDAVSTAMGQQGCDIKLSNAARIAFPFGIECKCVESLNLWESWKQATTNAEKESLIPLLFVKRNHVKPIMIIDAEVGLSILQENARLKGLLKEDI
ncbi:MAG TPA: hypothetical protein VN372_05245 [Methanospirillum sp.]|nr:hypothetical protein [Methanospirillum sp.]